jgi:tRNA A37 N6-isopentenylltransferase MiaA
MARKTEVYTWRVSPVLKAGLEEAARSGKRTVAQLLDEIVAEHLRSGSGRDRGEDERQRRLQCRAAAFAGRIAGRDPRRAERARELVRARLRRAGRAR